MLASIGAAIFGWVIKSTSSGVLTRIANSLLGDNTNKAIVTVAAIKAEIASREASRDIILAEQGHFWTRMIRPAFAYPLAIWWAAVIADSVYFHSHSVQALPAPLDKWAGWIVAAMFVTSTAENMTRGIMYTLMKWWKGK